MPDQDFDTGRAEFLGAQVRSLVTHPRMLNGADFSLEDQVTNCLDVPAEGQSEDVFLRKLTQLDGALPGPGTLRRRFRAISERTTLAPGQTELVLNLMERILSAARRRSERFLRFPEGEGQEVVAVQDKPYGAANRYQGGFRSRLELNMDRPVNLLAFIYQLCHEGYPGHHTEFTAKDRSLLPGAGIRRAGCVLLGPIAGHF